MKQFDLFENEKEDADFLKEAEEYLFYMEGKIEKLEEEERFYKENQAFNWAKEFPQLSDENGNFESKYLQGMYFGFYIPSIKNIPIKIPSEEIKNNLIKIVDKILNLEENKINDFCKLQKEIDKIIYKLYGLTKNEIKIIENKTI